MRNISILKLFVLLFLVSAIITNSIEAKEDYKEVKYKTSATCEACKTKIEDGLKKLDGIVKSELNLDDKVVTVQYNPEKITPNKIKKTINKLGYKTEVPSVEKTTACPEMKRCKKSCCPMK